MTEFSMQLPRTNQVFALLPLFHTCDAYDARRYVRAAQIDSEECDVFHENIVYLFYGRPAFKFEWGEASSRDLAIYPVSFIFSGLSLKNIKRVFPFDSGAMNGGRYKRHFHKKVSLLDFELEGDLSRISDIVLRYFGSNENYINLNNISANFDPSDFESAELAELYRSMSSEPADERRVTMEVQADQTVSLTADSLMGLIVPEQLLGDPLFETAARANNAEIESYPILAWNPAQCFGQVQEASRRFLQRRNYLP